MHQHNMELVQTYQRQTQQNRWNSASQEKHLQREINSQKNNPWRNKLPQIKLCTERNKLSQVRLHQREINSHKYFIKEK